MFNRLFACALIGGLIHLLSYPASASDEGLPVCSGSLLCGGNDVCVAGPFVPNVYEYIRFAMGFGNSTIDQATADAIAISNCARDIDYEIKKGLAQGHLNHPGCDSCECEEGQSCTKKFTLEIGDPLLVLDLEQHCQIVNRFWGWNVLTQEWAYNAVAQARGVTIGGTNDPLRPAYYCGECQGKTSEVAQDGNFGALQ